MHAYLGLLLSGWIGLSSSSRLKSGRAPAIHPLHDLVFVVTVIVLVGPSMLLLQLAPVLDAEVDSDAEVWQRVAWIVGDRRHRQTLTEILILGHVEVSADAAQLQIETNCNSVCMRA